MTIVRQKPLKTSVQPPKTSLEKYTEAERMRDVLLLLQNLINSEEATVKLILDCLYDVGSVNLINQKLRFRPVNRVMKLIARMSKPVFRTFALKWFKKNCPQLITNWLQSKVSFKDPPEQPEAVAIEVKKVQANTSFQTENLIVENKNLRYQVRWLAGISVAAIACLGGVTLTLLN